MRSAEHGGPTEAGKALTGLAVRAKSDPSLVGELCEACRPLARRYARGRGAYYARQWADRADFHAWMGVAVLRALRAFDPARGCQFSTLLHKCFRTSKADYLAARHDVPRWVADHGLPAVLNARVGALSLEAMSYHDGREMASGTLDELAVEDGRFAEVDEADASRVFRAWLDRTLARLPAKQAAVIRARFGRAERPTIRQVGEEMGLGKTRVQQLETAALCSLRDMASRDNLAERLGVA